VVKPRKSRFFFFHDLSANHWNHPAIDVSNIFQLPGLVMTNIAIENGHRNSGITMNYPLKMVIFHSFVNVYQRVYWNILAS
jgi:hypothetical protein